jgi:hypothetical protein
MHENTKHLFLFFVIFYLCVCFMYIDGKVTVQAVKTYDVTR